MRIFLIITMIILGGGAIGQGQRFASPSQPPPAVARICGNVVVPHSQKTRLFRQIQAEGCEDVRFVHVGDGFWLGYGTKVIVGEASWLVEK